MPVQTTFTLVPTTLRNTTLRPPMTSKAAKKAYREATRLPKMSRVERRRLEAEEIARQKKEYEKEKAAAKAKAAREKKLNKEAEEKAKRRAMGLPEPNRFVRPSQPTIKTFVKTGAGQKRVWEDVEVKDEDQIHDRMQLQDESESYEEAETPAKRAMLKRADDDDEDEFGDFPILSQHDLPSLLGESAKTSRTTSILSSTHEAPDCELNSQSPKSKVTDNLSGIDRPWLDTKMAKCAVMPLLTEAQLARINELSSHPSQSPTISRGVRSSLCKITTENPAMLSSDANWSHFPCPNFPASNTNQAKGVDDERSRLMPPPSIPMTVNRLSSRIHLRERSVNVPPPSRTSRSGALASASGPKKVPGWVPRCGASFVPPPSTLAFLEAHLDDFFPSPSQQVRELLEDVNDVPSNTQIAREIGTSKPANEDKPAMLSVFTPKSQSPVVDEEFHFLSSQDLEISSQDLRDIDTPSKLVQRNSVSKDGTKSCQIEMDITLPPPRTPRLKPRFFEEKEDDLLHAAMHESLSLAKLITQGSSPRRFQRAIHEPRLPKSDHACDDYGYFGSETEADFLSLLEGV